MSTGRIARSEYELVEILSKLKPMLQTGVSLYRAVCMYNDTNPDDYVAYAGLREWKRRSAKCRQLIKTWQNYPNIYARKVWIEGMAKDPKLAVEWLKRTERDTFGDKVEQIIPTKKSENIDLTAIPTDDLDTLEEILDKLKQDDKD